MKREGSQGLMAFWADIEPANLLRFQEWHNCEHIPERISIPGFNLGRRYRGIGEAPSFLMFYETDAASVFASDAYMARLNDPTPWTQEALTYFRNPSRNIYSLLAETGQAAPMEAPYIRTFRFNMAEDAVSRLSQEWLPSVGAMAGVYRVRLYAVDEEISGIMTSERQIYGGGPGQQRYLAMIESERSDNGGEAGALTEAVDLFAESFWLEIALHPSS
ncbi:MAG: hypothetical protein QGG19_10390 [Alphaproteobacteria bacterium]|jgi:hypothetical protein|nr:hypothetical protein [Rhodospirillaceae bacterium]MDP6021689.1 hypothetical protein [Alphaproteobacteria bacterium]MDP6257367.1 hypothetical protein [Alphaproteobacteria bacterium]MDP7055302.1 hypothetical protein [Alphaproteobacteria bacterium]MDP7229059.1 hypothetical protein [Alphaproteobacteria bacterium]|tara:strand:+ start:3756 stop:4409 length:654 start_codon:yes stop_codon:yes gene_type:complete